MKSITIMDMQRHFDTFTQALRETGMEAGHRAATATWAICSGTGQRLCGGEEEPFNELPVHVRGIQRNAISFEIWTME